MAVRLGDATNLKRAARSKRIHSLSHLHLKFFITSVGLDCTDYIQLLAFLKKKSVINKRIQSERESVYLVSCVFK